MRKSFVFYFCLLVPVLNNCSKAPVYPDTPQIEFSSLTEAFDDDSSLVVTVSFKDGNGDIGLDQNYTGYPYEEFDYVRDGNGNYIEYGSPGFTTLTCNNNDTIQLNSQPTVVLVQPNPNHYNYFLDIYYNEGGTYTKLDLSSVCPSFNGRVPLLAPASDKGPIEGDLSYRIPEFYPNIKDFFDANSISTDKVKLKIYIQDRALHKSNVVETPEISLHYK